MKLITDLFENVIEITDIEMEDYINISKHFPKESKELIDILHTLHKYKIYSKDDVEDIKNINSPKLKALSSHYKIPENELLILSKSLKNIKNLIQALPMYMHKEERESLISGDKTLDDIILDLVSNKGRTLIVKQFTPLINKIVNQYIGKSALNRAELLSSAMMGITKAMNDYKKPNNYVDASDENINKDEVKKNKGLSFKQYAGWRIRNQILNDINNLSRNVRIPQNATEKGIKYTPVRFGNNNDNENTDIATDRLLQLSEVPDYKDLDNTEKKEKLLWKEVFKEIENKFGVKQSNIFFRNFGVNGFLQEKMTDIAKLNNVSVPYVSMVIKKIIKWCSEYKKARLFLNELLDAISESILISNIDKEQIYIYEAFINNDIFILIEDITKYNNKYLYENMLIEVLSKYSQEAYDSIIKTLKTGINNQQYLYNFNENLYKDFLESMYPTIDIKNKDELYIIKEMNYLSDIYQKYNINI